MTDNDQMDNESQERLQGLAMIIKEIYLPALESKPETRHSISKFTTQIHTAISQAYGNVTIYVPQIEVDEEEEVARNPQMIEKLQGAVEDWEKKIKEIIEKEDRKIRERSHTTAQGETDFWALRSGTFNTLYQQLNMPNVKKIIRILENKDSVDAFSIESFKTINKDFGKQHAQAKDFVKFLATLDRQFKNISRGDLKAITETMPSLLNGLKLIWTISRHINHNEDKFEDILEAISNEICQKVRDKIDIRTIFKKKPDAAINDIDAGIQCLDKWWGEFNRTKTDIEGETTITRWDFPKIREIFSKPKHMTNILKNVKHACIVQKEFFAILGNDLKAVTGSSEQIDAVSDTVLEQVQKLANFQNDVFNPDSVTEWMQTFSAFEQQIENIELTTVQLINDTFKQKLNSSVGAFLLLDNFKNIKTRQSIEEQLANKYEDVLQRYQTELREMEELFQKHYSNPPIPKNMPEKSGSIAWARSIIKRIKAPIDMFKEKPQILTEYPAGQEVAKKYVEIAKHLTETHEFNIFKVWSDKKVTEAITMLKKPILRKENQNGPNLVYKVNFDPNLKVIIKEARFLDRIGKEIPHTIINIALQAKDYARHINKLNQLLRAYNTALLELRPVEKKLLTKQINKLNRSMEKGIENHNWFSLSIGEYIKECQKGIEDFKETKGRVLQHSRNIEKQVRNIENAVLIRHLDFKNHEIMDVTKFSEYFDTHRTKVLDLLIKDYQNIGDIYLKSIEECTFKTATRNSEEMRQYYYYWEKKIFNAITRMVIRALATNKALLTKTGKPMIKMTATYNHPDMSYHPTKDELRTQLDKFNRNILDSTKKFGRWWDGYCKIFDTIPDKDSSEQTIPFSFFDDVNHNPVITALNLEIVQQAQTIEDKFTLHAERFHERAFKVIYDKNEMTKMQKAIEKSASVTTIEKRIMGFKTLKRVNIKSKSSMIQNFLVLVDYSDVLTNALEKVNEWLASLGKVLTEIAKKELAKVKEQTSTYEEKLKIEANNIDPIKELLKIIDEIRNRSMDMELKIGEVQEQFRVLRMYKYDIDEEDQASVDAISDNWAALTDAAERRNFELESYKATFADITKKKVLTFKDELKEAYAEYLAMGPGADSVSLEEGVTKLAEYSAKCLEFNIQKDENVLSENLFNLPISKFQELIDMETKNELYNKIYTIYEEHREAVKEWSIVPWSKLDPNILEAGATKFEKQIKRLGQTLTGGQGQTITSPDQIPPFLKLKNTIQGFKTSIPFIQELNHPAVVERHWKRIMEETGKDFGEGDFNLKFITLSKVFELELQYHQEKVTEICKEAKEEASNEEHVAKIENEWKHTSFDIREYKKGEQTIGFTIKSPEEIKQQLDDNMLILGSVGASKYARSVKKKVADWERDLNLVFDVIESWMAVQRKWIYLESIFSSEDIRIALPEEAKKFNKTDINYRKIMDNVAKNPNVLSCCVRGDSSNRIEELKMISAELDKCTQSLTNYLDSKKMALPRFYFISDEDLLEILGTSDPQAIQPHLLKLYDNNAMLTFGAGGKQITAMTSDEGEVYQFENPVKPEGNIEEWMQKIDEEMKKTLHVLTKKAVFYYAKDKRIEWVTQHIGMVTLVGTQIWWTFAIEDVFRRREKGDKQAMKVELTNENIAVAELIKLVREDLPPNTRKCINTLIILDVHARDAVDVFVRDSIMNSSEFAWESQLRFYWDHQKDNVEIRQCTGTFDYCYEYQGLNGRLVITPLTDRCVMTLTTALTFYLGGSPAGPAGTGKTETVKDLAKGLAVRCVVTNCGPTQDKKAMEVIFSGLIQTGFWGCFDEFNRINVEVLSVVSAQIKTIQQGLEGSRSKITFESVEMRLIPTIGIFITMNPGYAGRSELPDNLKALFRPVVMVVPDLLLICENMLMAEGFLSAKMLAKKMTVLYKLAQEQLSKAYHYDFGLRALKSVLVMAGQLKRTFSDLPEDVVLMRALRDMNMPKFVFDDVPLFYGLLQDLFPGLTADRVGHDNLKEIIVEILDANNNKHNEEAVFDDQVNKIMQLFETTETRHTTMIVGPTGSGKSVVINTLAAALKEETDIPTRIDIINAKMVTNLELYGVLDPDTRDWTDGLLSKIFKASNKPKDAEWKPTRNWIIYDGDVDALWVENMNSVMDDNRILTLPNGDRIRLQSFCKMLFEVFDLQYASPATISRCGMVYVDPKNLGYKPYYQKWLKGKFDKYGETMRDSLKDCFEKYIPPIMDRIFEGIAGEELVEPLQFITPRTNLNLVKQLCTLIDTILTEPDENPPQDFSDLEKPYIFCLTWSCGGALIQEDRDKFNNFVSQLFQSQLPHNLYDVCYDIKTQNLDTWERQMLPMCVAEGQRLASIIVPTVDTTRYSYLLRQCLSVKQPVMFCGDSGTAKTVTVQSAFDQMDASTHSFLGINFSSRTSSGDFQNIIEDNIEKKTLASYGPKTIGKKMIIFIDDLNMPTIDAYGTQAPNALLKFLIERNKLYQRGGDLLLRDIVDVRYVACISPPAGGNNVVDPRLMSLYNVFNVTFPSKDAIQKIFSSLLTKHLQEFHENMIATVDQIVQATLQLYFVCLEKLPRTPLKFHYIFNLRDISRVFEGLYLSTLDKFKSKASFIRLWRNECHRVFGDRLVNESDRDLVLQDAIPSLIRQHFKDCEEEAMANPILFSDFMLSDPTDDEVEDPRLYEDLGGFEELSKKMNKMLEDYNDEKKIMNLVLFNDALEHLTKIHRMIRFPKGCGLLVGYGGSGKQSLTRLATFVACYELFTITLSRNYKEDDFKMELKELFGSVLKKPRTFMFTDAHVAEEGFLELINNILTVGMVPALFPEEEKENLISPLDKEIRQKKLPETKEFRWNYFVNRARENLHIMLCMSPAGETLKLRCRSFPGLISNSFIDWFFPWPEDALSDVASYFIKNVDIDDETKKKTQNHIVMIHLSVQKYSEDFEAIYKRKNFSTPKNYLDFIDNYMQFIEQKRKKFTNAVQRLEGGLTTLAKAQEDTQVLKEELAVQNAEIAEKKAIVEELLADIAEKSEIAGKQQKAASEKKKELDIQSVEIARESALADKKLEEAQPAIEAAVLAVADIKPSEISEIKALAQPAVAIFLVCQIAYYLMEANGQQRNNDDWGNIKLRMIGKPHFLQDLKDYNIASCSRDMALKCKKAMSNLAKEIKITGERETLIQEIKYKSAAAGGLFKWCQATDSYYDVYREVEPMKKRAAEMQKKKVISEEELRQTEANLKELNESLAELNANKAIKQGELDILEARSAEMTRKLNSASKLITGLGAEQKRWTIDMEQYKVDKVMLVGDCLSASSFLSYCGPFNFVMRKKMLFDHWKKDLIEKDFPNSDNFNLSSFLSNDVEISRWASEGLPGDDLSIQNGILTNFASRWPLCIDPQMQAVQWIKNKEAGKIKVLTFNMSDYVKQLEIAIKFGAPVLFEGIDVEIDPIIDPVLEKNIVVEAGVKIIVLADNKIEWHDDFQLFMTTKIANPSYSPEVFGKTMIINFNVTLLGLRDQLLNEVVGYERPELEATRVKLVKETSANRTELKELEDTLLSELSKETDVPLVDNDPLIEVLETAKTKSVKIGEDLENARVTTLDIEANRESYKPVAKRGAVLFFALTGLSAISDMYENSLDMYRTVFMNAMETSKKDNVLQARLRFIIEKLTQLVYEFTCMGIFEKHKLMFSFQMTTMIMDGEDELNREEMDFFLKGNTSLDAVEGKPFKWLNNNGWKDLCKLNELGTCWASICEDIRDNERKWKTWYDLEAPEEVKDLPCGYTEKTNNDKFKALLLVRCFRPDRVINAIKRFIITRMNDFYVKSPPLSYSKIFKQSTEKTPVVFILSPGADPHSELNRLVEDVGIGNSKLKFNALGEGQGDPSKQMIESGSIRGHWVLLLNCHLLASWLKKLDQIIENLHKPDKSYRLWLTTMPIHATAEHKFPLSILQKSLKVVTEPPDGLGANIRQNMSKLKDEDFENCPKQEFKTLCYVLSFFHATIQERKKYGKIGWNVNYDFNDSDFRISFRLISLYLNKANASNEEALPWETMRYLIGDAMYGGRVTDNWDRRILVTYLHEFMGDFIFDQNQKFFFSKTDYEYTIPDCEDMEQFQDAIDEIPLFTSPGVFGLHTNAEISYFTNSAKELWINTLMMQTSDGAEAGAVNKEDYIEKVASDILGKLPEVFDIYNIKKQFDTPTPTQIVLIQELARFNILLDTMQSSLFDLQRALGGEIGMSAVLDELANCMFNGWVPPMWSIKAPQTLKNLVNWIDHFDRRYQQYKDWVEVEEPKVIWLSGLHIPESYLTALVQSTCRAKTWALDKVTRYTVVTNERNPANIRKRLEHGTYVQGLFLEGAKWNMQTDCLDYQEAKQLITEMPLVRIVPIEANKLKLRGTIKTPVYVTAARKNPMGVGQVFEADLKTDKHVSHWVLQGVALVLNID